MPTIEELEARINNLEHRLDSMVEERLGVLEDINQIERLQYSYGYYIDMLLYDEMAALFSENGAIEIGQRGRYIGRDNIRHFLYEVLGTGQAGLSKNQIINHTQHQGIVSVDPDRQSAHGRFRAIIQASGPAPVDGQSAASESPAALMWSDGVYENRYVKENGQWKISLLWWSPTFYVTHPVDRLWFDTTPVSDKFPPQAASCAPDPDLGKVFVPYHYVHPITGERVVHKVVR